MRPTTLIGSPASEHDIVSRPSGDKMCAQGTLSRLALNLPDPSLVYRRTQATREPPPGTSTIGPGVDVPDAPLVARALDTRDLDAAANAHPSGTIPHRCRARRDVRTLARAGRCRLRTSTRAPFPSVRFLIPEARGVVLYRCGPCQHLATLPRRHKVFRLTPPEPRG